MKNLSLLICLFAVSLAGISQTPYLTISGGLMNYQGDLQPNSFTISQSKPFAALGVRVPFGGHLAFRGSVMRGAVRASDANNRDYLRARNLSFESSITEVFAGAEISVLNTETHRISPFISIGMAGFHFNPYAHTTGGTKVFLQPLSTEGQGLAQYPDRKPYDLNQLALAYSGGLRVMLSEQMRLVFEFAQRKTFTDYLDDVSSSYVDESVLRQARGNIAGDMAYRGDEFNGTVYPKAGEQRGTPTEKDWYYTMGATLEVSLQGLGAGWFQRKRITYSDTRCPNRF